MPLFPQRSIADTDADAAFVEAMRRAGATSPANACADRDLPHLTRDRFRDLLDRGVLREAAPGTFYLYEQAIPASTTWPRVQRLPSRTLIKALLFWLLVILVPVLLIQLTR